MTFPPPGLLLKSFALVGVLLVIASCHPPGSAGHGEEGKGHEGKGGQGRVISLTRFSEQTELFVEFSPLVLGERAPFAVHLTRLDNFKPVDSGEITVELLSGTTTAATFQVIKPSQPGIFRPVVIPETTGRFGVRLRWTSEGQQDAHDLGEWTVYPNADVAKRETGGDSVGAITLLKEQQWFLDFATAPVERKTLRPSASLYATLRPRPGSSIELSAPTAGRLEASAQGWPRVGVAVEAGQILATIAPRLEEGGSDLASLRSAVKQARIQVDYHQHDVERLETLFDQGVIPKQRVLEAQGELAHARVSMNTAKQRLSQRQRSQTGNATSVEVRAPFSGTIRNVLSVPQTSVESGASLFEIAEPQALWLEVHVPERMIPALPATVEGGFELPGDPTRYELLASHRVPGLAPVDPVTRTAALRYELSPESNFPVGARARAYLYTEAPTEAVVVPRQAVIQEGGQSIVFVMRTGESFERRPVRLGMREGDFHEVLAGLELKERVVNRGAYIVKLAASSNQVPDHGHAH